MTSLFHFVSHHPSIVTNPCRSKEDVQMFASVFFLSFSNKQPVWLTQYLYRRARLDTQAYLYRKTKNKRQTYNEHEEIARKHRWCEVFLCLLFACVKFPSVAWWYLLVLGRIKSEVRRKQRENKRRKTTKNILVEMIIFSVHWQRDRLRVRHRDLRQ